MNSHARTQHPSWHHRIQVCANFRKPWKKLLFADASLSLLFNPNLSSGSKPYSFAEIGQFSVQLQLDVPFNWRLGVASLSIYPPAFFKQKASVSKLQTFSVVSRSPPESASGRQTWVRFDLEDHSAHCSHHVVTSDAAERQSSIRVQLSKHVFRTFMNLNKTVSRLWRP